MNTEKKSLQCDKCLSMFSETNAVKTVINLPNGGYDLKASCPYCYAYNKFLPHNNNTHIKH
ncbi:MAG: tramtrack DNA-binding domain protein [Podoviridae sp. cty5g4]|nr:MAG: tramtrack DNA-binding domain protein [Podoviridae sp. cty5g4]